GLGRGLSRTPFRRAPDAAGPTAERVRPPPRSAPRLSICARAARRFAGPARSIRQPTSVHAKLTIEPTVVSPSGIAPELLDADAVRTVQRLVGRGYEAYFGGGCVRDILLGRQPMGWRPSRMSRTQ